MSLRDGAAKMSKSDPSDMSRINLTDDADTILTKIKKAKSDSEPLPESVAGLEGRAEATNLIGIYAAMTGESVDTVLARYAGKGFGVFKPALAELLIESLSPISARFTALKDDHAAIDAILEKGAVRAAELAAPTLAKTYATMGLAR